jgi:hypothetical protein
LDAVFHSEISDEIGSFGIMTIIQFDHPDFTCIQIIEKRIPEDGFRILR